MSMPPASLAEFTPYKAKGPYKTYSIGDKSNPPVLVMHETPNLSSMVLGLAKRISGEGFFVVTPSLTGTPEETGPFVLPRELLRVCISEEFRVWACDESGRITDWLRDLCRKLHAEHGGRGVGAIGLCLTGNFALTLVADGDAKVVAPVMSEPSLPFPIGCKRAAAIHISPDKLRAAKARLEKEDLKVLGLRFTTDIISPPPRFQTLRQELRDRFEEIEIETGGDIPHGAHSVLTKDFMDKEGHPTKLALDRVLALLKEKLT